MIHKQVKLYSKSGEEMLNSATGTKTDMNLNMNIANTAKHFESISS